MLSKRKKKRTLHALRLDIWLKWIHTDLNCSFNHFLSVSLQKKFIIVEKISNLTSVPSALYGLDTELIFCFIYKRAFIYREGEKCNMCILCLNEISIMTTVSFTHTYCRKQELSYEPKQINF